MVGGEKKEEKGHHNSQFLRDEPWWSAGVRRKQPHEWRGPLTRFHIEKRADLSGCYFDTN
jgi:hypothetical protein